MPGPISEISYSNVKSVTIKDVSAGESVGRRFEVGNIPGKNDKKVIFHDLFKQAKALLHDAKTREELHATKEFIGKLRHIESNARVTYKLRDDKWYKFKSFWNRLFGGAFWGTHFDRLDQLEKSCVKKEERCLNKLKKQALQINRNDMERYFSAGEVQIQVGDLTYKVWVVNSNQLHIEGEDGKKLKILIGMTGCTIEGEVSGNELDILQKINDEIVSAKENRKSVKKAWNESIHLNLVSNFSEEVSVSFKGRELNVWADNNRYLHIQDKNNKNEHLKLTITTWGSCERVSGIWHGDVEGLIQVVNTTGQEIKRACDALHLSIVDLEKARDHMVGRPHIFNYLGKEYLIWRERGADGILAIHLQQKIFEGTKENQVIAHIDNLKVTRVIGNVDANTENLFRSGIASAAQRPTSGAIYARLWGMLSIRLTGQLVDPLLHFQRLGAQLADITSAGLHVMRTDGPEADAGGVRRDFVSTLVEALSGQENLFVEVDGAFKLPSVKRNGNQANLTCNSEEKDLFQSLGRLFYICHQAAHAQAAAGQYDRISLNTGRVFSEGLFHSAFSLTEDEIAKPFENLSIEAKVRMAKSLVAYLDQRTDDAGENIVRTLDFLDKGHLMKSINTIKNLKEQLESNDAQRQEVVKALENTRKQLESDDVPEREKVEKALEDLQTQLELDAVKQKELEKALEKEQKQLTFAALLVDEEYLDDVTYTWADEDKILQHEEAFRQQLYDALFSDPNLIKPLNGVALASVLDPIFQVAVGMKTQGVVWDTFRTRNVTEVSMGIQGSMDRDLVAASITYSGNKQVIKDKVGWLTHWIKEDATEDELKQFLKFLSGGTSLPKDKKIKIEEQIAPSPNPAACTCGMKMSISHVMQYAGNPFFADPATWDDTAEKFIENVKFVIRGSGFTVE